MKILAVTSLASIQDLGRFGQRKHGIGRSGAMDAWAVKLGNALLKNSPDTPAIEVTLGGLTVEFEQDTTFCLTGAYYEAHLDGVPVYNAWRTHAKAGQILTLVRAKQGLHGYICVQGGFDLPKVLNSYSTNTKAEFGGLHGALLKVGDTIPLVKNKTDFLPIIGVSAYQDSCFTDPFFKQTPSLQNSAIRVVKNSEFEAFSEEAVHAFFNEPWKLSSSSNRMGYRFESETGNELSLKQPLQMNSHGVDMGMIQVPPQGQPIVLMADTQTTGGYPKIASVIEADIGRLAQTRFGQKQQFHLVTLAEAIGAKDNYQRYIDRVRNYANGN